MQVVIGYTYIVANGSSCCFFIRIQGGIREFKITTAATATGTSLNKRFNEQNNGSARAL